jgi:hypothetical protein
MKREYSSASHSGYFLLHKRYYQFMRGYTRPTGFIFVTVALASILSCSGAKMKAGVDTEPMSVEQETSAVAIEEMVAKISTEVDPAFVYQYEKSKFVPHAGKTLLIMGQDSKTISEYMDSFSGRPVPGGWTAYWGITSMNGVDRINAEDIGKQYGYQNHQTLVDRFPDTVLQSGLWMVGMWDVLENAGNGKYNPVIRQFSAWAKTIDRPLYLRIGYEFDGNQNQMEPVDYVKAYRRIVDVIRAEGADNVAFVWQSYAAPTYQGYPLSAWYPGDDYVDWVGISLFGQMYSPDLNKEASDVFNFAKAHRKPVMVAEASPINGIDKDNINAWNTWFVNFLSLTYRKNVKAISYINADWTSYPGFASLQWKDARLQNNQQLARAWFKETGKDRYLKQSAELYEQLGYIK